MARGTQLIQLVAKLRAETGRSDNVSAGRNEEPSLKSRLASTQELLYQSYDWPFLKTEATKSLAAGQRYYDWPTTINPDRLTDEIKLRWQNSWYPIGRGIGANEYNSYDPNDDERADPALRFEVRAVGNNEQIEIWPLPASNDQVLYFWGLRPLRALTENTHVADLDDNLIVWTLAAEILANQKSPNAKRVADKAAALYQKLTGNSRGGGGNLSLLDGVRAPRVVGTIIRVA